MKLKETLATIGTLISLGCLPVMGIIGLGLIVFFGFSFFADWMGWLE